MNPQLKLLGLQQTHLKGDSESVIKALQKGDMPMAHALTHKARLSFPLLVWMESIPFDTDTFVYADLLAS